METKKVISLLQKTPIFAKTSETSLEAMLKSAIQKSAEAGTKIVGLLRRAERDRRRTEDGGRRGKERRHLPRRHAVGDAEPDLLPSGDRPQHARGAVQAAPLHEQGAPVRLNG